MAGLLDRYRLTRPFGQNTALSDSNQGGPGGYAGSQFRRQEQAYGRALRLLDRQARRGDSRAAIDAIDVRNDALSRGVLTGGIPNAEETQTRTLGKLGAKAVESDMRSRLIDRQRGLMTANPAAKAGAGYGSPVGRETQPEESAPKVTLADQAAAATERSTLSGAFGEGAKSRLLERKRKRATVGRPGDSTYNSYTPRPYTA